jgi:hypothetical protein
VGAVQPQDEPDWYSATLHTSRLSPALGVYPQPYLRAIQILAILWPECATRSSLHLKPSKTYAA